MALSYTKGAAPRTQSDRPRGGPVLATRSRFYKNYPDVFRTSIEEQDYPKPGKSRARPRGGGKQESEED